MDKIGRIAGIATLVAGAIFLVANIPFIMESTFGYGIIMDSSSGVARVHYAITAIGFGLILMSIGAAEIAFFSKREK